MTVLVDAMQFMQSIYAEDLIDYIPTLPQEKETPTNEQLAFLKRNGILPESVKNAGAAGVVIDKLIMRKRENLTSPKQIRFLERLGFQDVGEWQFIEAKKLVDLIAGNGWKVPRFIQPEMYVPKSQRVQKTKKFSDEWKEEMLRKYPADRNLIR